MANDVAPEGKVYVCLACGKRSKDRYGNQKINQGWDESCMLNCRLFDEKDLVIENCLVVKVENTNAPTPPEQACNRRVFGNTNAPKATEQTLDGE